jgi:hypothetical protein
VALLVEVVKMIKLILKNQRDLMMMLKIMVMERKRNETKNMRKK